MKSQWRAVFLAAGGIVLFQSCGTWQRLSHASLEVETRGGKSPIKTADAVPLPPGDPSDQSPMIRPAPQPEPAPPPVESELLPPILTAATGPIVGSTQVTLELGTKRDWVKIQIMRGAGLSSPSCTEGVIVGEFDDPTISPLTLTDQTGAAGQDFSYTACLNDKDGKTINVQVEKSAASKPQIMFTSTPTVSGNMNGKVEVADDLCQQFASRSPRVHLRREEKWRAVISDNFKAARTRVRILGQVAASDFSLTNAYHTLFVDADNFWNSGLNANSGSVLDVTGNATQSPVWTGSNSDGSLQPGLTCQNWSSSVSTDFGQTGDSSTLLGSGWVNGGGPGGCDLQRSLYCIAEPRPLVEAKPAIGASGGIELTVTPPAGTYSGAYITIRRRAAAAGLPSLGCDSPFDTPISTITPSDSAPVVIQDELTAANIAYHYAACLIDERGHLIYSTRAIHTVASPATSQ